MRPTKIPLKYSFRLMSRKRIKNLSVLKGGLSFNAVAGVINGKEDKNRELDNGKRTFLKVAGVAGAGIIASQLLPKRAEALIMGSTPSSSVVGVKDSSNVRINPAKEDGNLATIKTNTDPLVVAGAGGYVRQDSTATIAKESGGNLATIAGKDFATQTTLATLNTTAATLATEESVILLRRIAKLSDSLGVVDSNQRQRVSVDTVTTVTTVTTTGTVTSATNLVALGGVDGRYLYIDTAHNVYANAIRPNLTFS